MVQIRAHVAVVAVVAVAHVAVMAVAAGAHVALNGSSRRVPAFRGTNPNVPGWEGSCRL